MKKIISVFMALVIVMAVFTACSGETDPSGNGTPAPGADATPAPGADATPAPGGDTPEDPEVNEYELIGIPEDINLNEKEINIYAWTTTNPEFEVDAEDLDGDPVADAVYKKNLYTEQLLNCSLEFFEWEFVSNTLTELNNACDRIKNAIDDSMSSVDIIANYPRVVATAALRGLCSDLSVNENIDLSKEWWPQNLQNELSIFDSMFFISGDISSNFIFYIYSMFYNKTLYGAYGYENIIELVDNGEWTVDKLIELTNKGYDDIDGVTGKSTGDAFAIVFDWWNIDAFIQGSGFKLLENDGEEGIKLSDKFVSATFGDYVEKLGRWCQKDHVYSRNDYEDGTSDIFADGRSVFLITSLGTGYKLQETEIDYGIIPIPKLDKSQPYVTTIYEYESMYAISTKSKNMDDAGAVLQTLGYYGLEYTTPAVFDVTLQGKFSKDEDTMRILNTIRSSVQFDLGLIYHRQIDSISDIPTLAIKNNEQWSIACGTRKQSLINKMLADINTTLKENLGI